MYNITDALYTASFVTNNDLVTIAKIALAHLNEFPNYYNKEYGLRMFEKMLGEKLNKNKF